MVQKKVEKKGRNHCRSCLRENIISTLNFTHKRGVALSGKIRGEKKREIFEIIKKAKKISLKEIRALTDVNYNTIRSSVIGLTKAGLIKRTGKGTYEVM